MTWYQQSLTPPDVLEINVRIGLIPSQDHWQWLAEVKDPVTGVLVGQISGPHSTMAAFPEDLETVLAKVRAFVLEHVAPF